MATPIRRTSAEVDTLVAAQNATRKSAIGAGANFHYATCDYTVAAANASDLATSLTLVNQIKRVLAGNLSNGGNWLGHLVDDIAHTNADTTNTVTAADAVDLATAITLANQLKARYNSHRSQASVHANNDATNATSSADSTDQSSLNTLLNELKTDINAHLASATGGTALRVVNA